eukprot:TRINITY_DN2623_c0_g1_i1.p1 TRINITY_DN2623_c0_g1~~TRINITY_DN2623_c0_g1_i1.p1  ORF type:complete len:360 (+),score=2.58 TRINITY_DN2623_c0_g1_i1:483-1562(+)
MSTFWLIPFGLCLASLQSFTTAYPSVPVKWTEGYLDVNDISIHYYKSIHASIGSNTQTVAGQSDEAAQVARTASSTEIASATAVTEAEKPILVFLHGLTFCAGLMINTATHFTSNFTVVLPDHRGHGESKPIPTGSFTFENLVSDAAALIRSVSPNGPVLLVGHSMGGAIAAQVAVEYPAIIAGLLLVEPPWNRPPGEPLSKAGYVNESMQAFNATATIENIKAVQELSWEEFSASDSTVTADSPVRDIVACAREFDTQHIAAPDVTSVDAENTVARYSIQVPVQLQVGDPSTADTVSSARTNHAVAKDAVVTYPKGQLVYFPGGTHFLFWGETRESWGLTSYAFLTGFLTPEGSLATV